MEIWKPIPGYEGIYEASNLGRIRSVPGKITSNARYEKRVWKTRVLKPKRQTSRCRGDGRVSLWKNGVQKDHLISRLVASAWLGKPEDGMTVNHINGDWKDNRPENLEWVTLEDNIRHGFRTGLYSSVQKTVILEDEISGDKIQFVSMASVDRFLDRATGYTSCATKHNRTLTSKNGSRFIVRAVL